MINNDGISFAMLVSIPKKLRAMLDFVGVDLNEPGQFKSLSWDFSNVNTQRVTLDVDANGEYVNFDVRTNSDRTFTEDGKDITPYEPTMIHCTEDWVKDIPVCMEQFIALERRVYDLAEELSAEINKKKDANLQAVYDEALRAGGIVK